MFFEPTIIFLQNKQQARLKMQEKLRKFLRRSEQKQLHLREVFLHCHTFVALPAS